MSRGAKLAAAALCAITLVTCGVWIWARRGEARVAGYVPDPLASTTSSGTRLHPPDRRTRRMGGLDVTFLVASDTHFGFDADERDDSGGLRDPVREPEGTDVINAGQIESMNAMPGRPWPAALGGVIGTPRGLVITGDLTENGDPWQWRNFVLYYGLNGNDGLVRYPVYEAHGNHDKHHSWYVLDRVRERHGGMRYSFDWDDLHLVCLGEAPDDKDLAWLAEDLEATGRERPVILYFHFPLIGPYSEDNWFGRGNYRETLRKTIEGYNVVAIFHGHYHASGHYDWHGTRVYNVGAAKHRRYSYAIVHVGDQRLRVASWQHQQKRWEWWHEMSINGAAHPSIEGGSHVYE